MLGRFSNEELYKFPRLTQAEQILWRQFIVEHGMKYERFDYDLPVGEGVDPGDSVAEFLRKDYIDLTRKRIDAVGYRLGKAFLFEVKPRAATTALGQLLTYKSLYNQTFPGIPVGGLSVVTSMINPDEAQVYKKFDIEIFIYPM